jgi:transaldolase
MKMFIDTANIEEIREALELGIISGVTTNPTLIAREKNAPEVLLPKIISLAGGIVNIEVNRLDTEGMIEEGRAISKMGDNVVVKIPMSAEGLQAVKVLSQENIRTNVTLVFSLAQAIAAANAGADYVSVFVGRLEDIGVDGISTIRDVKRMFRECNIKTEVIAASIRSTFHVIECAKAGIDIVTMPYKVLNKMLQHALTTEGIKKFVADWNDLAVTLN